MNNTTTLSHKFVEYIPDALEDKTIYISIQYATVVHNCVCGCGQEVITPLSPTDWKLIFDGDAVSLFPSIGNWGFKCQSHYWIKNNRVKWSEKWSQEEIENIRIKDLLIKQKYYDQESNHPILQDNRGKIESIVSRLISWLLGKT